ncbi:MAG TPA: ribosome small subunit-dependent GTPase A, partial [Bryobacteraceae bacterium]|nr:ribosome small subunit-dependent GTPase A [Bryobacteraceae bacterium]
MWTEAGSVKAVLAGTLRNLPGGPPVTGDWALLRADAEVVCGILERRTVLARAVDGQGAPQALASNVDVLLIVTGLDGDFSPRRIERYLVLAAESGIDPVVVLSKTDLCDTRRLEDAIGLVREAAAGVPVIPWSAFSGQDTQVISGCVGAGQTAAVAGSSGAGKSTLINRLLGEERQETREVRPDDSCGRHTTTRRELIALPQGWVIADLPGLRSVGVWASSEAVATVFSEVEELARKCRYRDCTHMGEPGCVVRAAVEAGDLTASRAASFGKLSREAGFTKEAKKRWEKTIA